MSVKVFSQSNFELKKQLDLCVKETKTMTGHYSNEICKVSLANFFFILHRYPDYIIELEQEYLVISLACLACIVLRCTHTYYSNL